jgi:hypothetical protein
MLLVPPAAIAQYGPSSPPSELDRLSLFAAGKAVANRCGLLSTREIHQAGENLAFLEQVFAKQYGPRETVTALNRGTDFAQQPRFLACGNEAKEFVEVIMKGSNAWVRTVRPAASIPP